MDEQLAMFVVESHRRSHPSAGQQPGSGGGTAEGEEGGEAEPTPIINDKVDNSCCWFDAVLSAGIASGVLETSVFVGEVAAFLCPFEIAPRRFGLDGM